MLLGTYYAQNYASIIGGSLFSAQGKKINFSGPRKWHGNVQDMPMLNLPITPGVK